MEALSGSVLDRTQLLCKFFPSRPNSLFPNQLRRNPIRVHRIQHGFHPTIPFWTSSVLSNGRNVKVSAQLRRVSKRRNSLRKKISEEQHQVRRKLEFDHQNPSFVTDQIELNTGSSNLCENNDGSVEKSNLVRDSVLWSELESWADQYKRDVEFWGVGSAPIFTVFQDSMGNVERVVVDEDEILRRNEGLVGEDLVAANVKISRANVLAREVERGESKLPKNSAVTKYVVSSKKTWFVDGLPSFFNRRFVVSKFPQIGFSVLCVFFIVFSAKRILFGGNGDVELTSEEKEMLIRKMKSRMKEEKMGRGSVEVLPVVSNPVMGASERPQLDKEVLMSKIVKASAPGKELKSNAHSRDFINRIQEIMEMAREARKLEQKNIQEDDNNFKNEKLSKESEGLETGKMLGSLSLNTRHGGHTTRLMNADEPPESPLVDKHQVQDVETGSSQEGSVVCAAGSKLQVPDDVDINVDVSEMMSARDSLESESRSLQINNLKEEVQFDASPSDELYTSNEINMKPVVIRSVKEARKYLRKKYHELELDKDLKVEQPRVEVDDFYSAVTEGSNGKERKMKGENDICEPSLDASSDEKVAVKACKGTSGLESDGFQSPSIKNNESKEKGPKYPVDNDQESSKPSQGSEGSDHSAGAVSPIAEESWLENNFRDFKSIVKKIGDGFRENYTVAMRNTQESGLASEAQPEIDIDDGELEWMKDDRLKEIVFQVRENELMGRDPFHMMDAEDKNAFFKGLERKVEKANEGLLSLHEWVHARVENLDYGVDGISLYDLPEKVIPRWKVPAFSGDTEVRNNFVEQRKTVDADNARNLPRGLDKQNSTEKSIESRSTCDVSNSSAAYNLTKTKQKGPKNHKTVIESSDGSSRPGKKSGKEYWQHTKKWSREFLEAYNAETDPEIKSIMKDMGKDLDRWITEKEVQEAADLLTKLPRKKRRYIEKKIDKLKREMETYGPQAVISKYREYAEEEKDYLWWLDLSFILCIELYTIEDRAQKVGFYSLEMAADLELDPKQHHVVAFEDPADSKNFCYILQAHMEMLGNGSAFVVARPPKDVFREAKANGFSVTVIKKGELQLNIDQMLEEVEEQITEIGSKIYHDKIMQERSVDMGSLMKGVLSKRN
ncbi:hypothetical protein Sjap_021152 [Stephania japonica]|uniref:Uncharacterized protein n=1 Tax=Stephania japonica TaxID=461633 RepID=A0AAP0F9F0_9MAGN